MERKARVWPGIVCLVAVTIFDLRAGSLPIGRFAAVLLVLGAVVTLARSKAGSSAKLHEWLALLVGVAGSWWLLPSGGTVRTVAAVITIMVAALTYQSAPFLATRKQ